MPFWRSKDEKKAEKTHECKDCKHDCDNCKKAAEEHDHHHHHHHGHVPGKEGSVMPSHMANHLLHPGRRFLEPPRQFMKYIPKNNGVVLEIGPAQGFFTQYFARKASRYIAVDIQPEMIKGLEARMKEKKLTVETRVCTATSLGVEDLEGIVDFIPVFLMFHEVPAAEKQHFADQLISCLKPKGTLVLTEPQHHVDAVRFAEEVAVFEKSGLKLVKKGMSGRLNQKRFMAEFTRD
ncbi:Methyltransferase domain [Carpediemonas membranifera]|uniref:Methyltransferase domain n=1 Tax=Carpediemonas membranifera TaxID=201153 RepID=A0A8J6DZJ4_9EUKA|nr:Methyltransferase domain [Carpediemonas membranifera]|eukprot:KAG9390476.1 Methyltransferase domain [Carpediemonas membranifera]